METHYSKLLKKCKLSEGSFYHKSFALFPIFVGDFYVYLIDLITLLVILSCNNLGKYTPTRQPEKLFLKKQTLTLQKVTNSYNTQTSRTRHNSSPVMSALDFRFISDVTKIFPTLLLAQPPYYSQYSLHAL